MARSQPKTLRSGDPISARAFNRSIVDPLQTATSVAPGLEKRKLGKSVAISADKDTRPPQFASANKKVKITAIAEDYLECVLYNERTETEQEQVIYVAKQRRFRPSLYDGTTITYSNGDVIEYTKDATNPEWKRQADNGSSTVDQIVIPCWYIGEVISCKQKATSVVTTPDGYYVNWEDDEKRVWAVI
jgi:hypothetical protein